MRCSVHLSPKGITVSGSRTTRVWAEIWRQPGFQTFTIPFQIEEWGSCSATSRLQLRNTSEPIWRKSSFFADSPEEAATLTAASRRDSPLLSIVRMKTVAALSDRRRKRRNWSRLAVASGVALGICCALPLRIDAQSVPPLSVETAQLALAHNRSIQIAAVDVKRSDAEIKAASTRRLASFAPSNRRWDFSTC
jgi:hypothetical protein